MRGSLSISDSTITENQADFGAGISNSGPGGTLITSLDRVIISNNTAGFSGGGIENTLATLSEIRNSIIRDILIELESAIEKYPEFPLDKIHQVAIVAEESGEAVRATLNHVYHGASIKDVEEELIQTGAMVIRMLETIKEDQSEG